MQPSFLPANNWSVMQKLLFRFFAIYFFIYIFPFPGEYIPFTDFLYKWYSTIWNALVPWAGKNILHVGYPITVKPMAAEIPLTIMYNYFYWQYLQ